MAGKIRARARKSRTLRTAYVRLHRAWRNAAQTPEVVNLRRSRRRLRSPVDESGLVVSLTSFPARIGHAWIPIESMFRQDRRPDRIVLVLSDEEFGSLSLPQKLLEQQDRGLEILYVARNARGLDKLLPTRAAYPSATIITVDDDAIYEPWAVSRLVEHAAHHPDTVIGHRGREIRLDGRGLLPYHQWPMASRATPAGRVLLTGVGAILYPPDAVPTELLADTALAMELCPTADDIWFWAVATVSGVPIHCLGLPSWRALWRQAHTPRSVTVNRREGRNDVQLSRVIEHFDIPLRPDRDGCARPEPVRPLS
jgi:hypothetical protein